MANANQRMANLEAQVSAQTELVQGMQQTLVAIQQNITLQQQEITSRMGAFAKSLEAILIVLLVQRVSHQQVHLLLLNL